MSKDQTRRDIRPVLVFCYWPMELVALAVGGFMLYLVFNATFSGSLLPVYLVLFIGLLGLVALPFLVSSTVWQFRGRGFRGFWAASRATDWGPKGRYRGL